MADHQDEPGQMTWHDIPTDQGCFRAAFTERGLARLEFPNKAGNNITPSPEGKPPPWLATTCKAIEAILSGKSPAQLPPVDLGDATSFQLAVWQELQGIKRGRTKSYGEVARAVGKPGAARAVGAACGANPIPLIIPCHRVLAASRRIGGFSGSLPWKKRLLKIEGVAFVASGA